MAIIVTDASDARYKEIKIMLDKMNYELLKLKAAVMKKYTKIEILGEFYDVSILKSEVTKENDSKITANIVVIKSGITSAVSLLYAKWWDEEAMDRIVAMQACELFPINPKLTEYQNILCRKCFKKNYGFAIIHLGKFRCDIQSKKLYEINSPKGWGFIGQELIQHVDLDLSSKSIALVINKLLI